MSSILQRSPRKQSRMHEESMHYEIDAETRKIQILQARRQEATQRILSAYQKPQINHERNLQYLKESQIARDKARQQEDHKERIAVLKMQQHFSQVNAAARQKEQRQRQYYKSIEQENLIYNNQRSIQKKQQLEREHQDDLNPMYTSFNNRFGTSLV